MKKHVKEHQQVQKWMWCWCGIYLVVPVGPVTLIRVSGCLMMGGSCGSISSSGCITIPTILGKKSLTLSLDTVGRSAGWYLPGRK